MNTNVLLDFISANIYAIKGMGFKIFFGKLIIKFSSESKILINAFNIKLVTGLKAL